MNRMITRTVPETKVKLIYANRDTMKMEETEVTIPGVYRSDVSFEKAVNAYVPENCVLIKQEVIEKTEKIYGVSIEDFMKIAVEVERSAKKEASAESEGE